MKVLTFLIKNFEELVAGVFMVLMSLATFGNVICRYLFNNPIQWAEEFSRYAFIWVVFMGAAICTKRKRHIVIDGFVLLLPRRIQPLFSILVGLITLGLMAVVFYYGMVLASSANQPTATLRIPQYLVYIVVPLSAVLIATYALQDLRRDVQRLLRRGETS